MRPRDLPNLMRLTALAWWDDNVFRLAASLAFYTTLSLAPITLVAVALAGIAFGEESAKRQLVDQVGALIGSEGGRAIETMVASLHRAGGGPIAAVIGTVSVLVGSTAVFAELQSALNKIWDVRTDPDRGALGELVRKRLLSLVLVVGVGFLLLVSLVLDATVAGAQAYVAQGIPLLPWIWQATSQILSLALATVLFMMIYKLLPDVQLSWRDVAVGALVTALLFSLGRHLIGLYIGRISVGSAYGAAGSFVVLLLWVYYSALISFFGAEFTQVYARREGSGIRPEEHAVRRGEKDGAT